MTYDAARSTVVLFGGQAANGDQADTWVWTGTTWSQKFPATSPSPRQAARLAYDAATGTSILFGGHVGAYNGTISGFLNDTWSWDGTTWSRLYPATSPWVRADAMMAYDARLGKIVLFGGEGGAGPADTALNDTWLWDGANWALLYPLTPPSPRQTSSFVYDPATQRTVLFGGSPCCTASSSLNDTWNFDGSTWTQLSPATSPTPRADLHGAYNATMGKLVLFGGSTAPNDSGTYYNDTWLWDGTTWAQAAGIASPSARDGIELGYDALRGQLVLFGGYNGTTLLGDTWTYGTAIPTLSKTLTTATVTARGSPVTYVLTVGNAGATTLSGVSVADTSPQLGFGGVTPTLSDLGNPSNPLSCGALGLTCTATATTLSLSGLTIPAQDSLRIAYSAVAVGLDRQCSVINNSAIATASSGTSAPASAAVTVCDSGLGVQNWWSYVTRDLGAGAKAMVNVANGNLVVQQMDGTSIQGHGRLGFVLRRTYNSQDSALLTLPGTFGAGWQLNVAQTDDLASAGVGTTSLYVPPGETALTPLAVTMVDRGGTRHIFTPKGLATSAAIDITNPPSGPLAELVPQLLHLDGGFTNLCIEQTFQAPPGVHLGLWRYIEVNSSVSNPCSNIAGATNVALVGFLAERPDRVRYEYAWDGHIVGMLDGAGNALYYKYNTATANSLLPGITPQLAIGQLASISDANDATGRAFTFSYSDSVPSKVTDPHQIAVTDPAQRTTIYTFDADVHLAGPLQTAHLLSVQNPTSNGGTISYRYGQSGCPQTAGAASANQLCSVTDALGHTSTFTYQASTLIGALPPVSAITDRRGTSTALTYTHATALPASVCGVATTDYVTADVAGERQRFECFDSTGRVGELDEGNTSDTYLHQTISTWDVAGGTSCQQPLIGSGVDNNLCRLVRRSLSTSTPDEDTSYLFNPEGGMLRKHQLTGAGALDSTWGYRAQYVEASGKVGCFTDSVAGNGSVVSAQDLGSAGLGCDTSTDPRGDAATLYALLDQTQSLTPRGNAAGSGYAAYLTTSFVDDKASVRPNVSLTGPVCSNPRQPTTNTGLVCETDAPAWGGTNSSGLCWSTTSTCTQYVYDTHGQRAQMTTPKSIAETPSGQAAPSYTYTYYPDPSQSNDATQTRDLSGTTPQGGWLKGETDPTGHFVAFAYDAAGNVARTWDRDATTNAAPPSNTLAAYPGTISSPPSSTYAETLHGSGSTAYSAPWRFVLSKRDPLTNLTTQTVDANGNQLTERPPRGNAAGNSSYDVSRAYDANDNLVTLLMPAEATANKPTTYAYDALNNRTATTDPNGSVTVTQYDAVNRTTASLSTRGPWPSDTTTVPPACRQSTSADSPIPAGRILCSTTIAYDGVDNKAATQDGNHQTTTVTYDGVHRAVRLVGPRSMTYGNSTVGGTETETSYDADGHPTDVCPPRQFALGEGGFAPTQACQQPAAYSQHMTYDAMGRLATNSTYRLVGSSTVTETTTSGYDADGNGTSTTDANGHTTTTTFDVLDRKASTSVPRSPSASSTTSYVHDPVGNTTAVVQPGLDVGDGRDGALVIDGSQYPQSNPYVLTDATKQYSAVTLQNGGWMAPAFLEVPGGGALILRVSGAVTICTTCGIDAGGRGWWAGTGGVASGPNYNGGAGWGPGGGGGGGSSYVDGGGGGGGGNIVAGGDGVGGAFGINGFAGRGGYQADAKDIAQEDVFHLMGAGGGGGGAGGLIYNGGDGGRGGGYVHITAGSIDDEGWIQAHGYDGVAGGNLFGTDGAGGGGGGSGGSVWLSAPTIALGSWSAIWVHGAPGGSGTGGDNGGAGANGRIRIDADTLTGIGYNGNNSWVNPARHVAGRVTAYSFDIDNRVVDTVTGADNLDATKAGLVSADGGTNVRSRVAYDADGRIAARFEPRAFVSSTLVPDPLFMSRTDYDQDGRATAQYVPRWDNVDDGGAYSDGYTSDSSPDTQQQQCPKGATPQAVATAPAYPANVGVCVTHLAYDASGKLNRVVLPTTSSTNPVPNRVVNYVYTDDNLRLVVDGPSPASTSSASPLCPSGDTSTGPRAVTCSLYDGDGKVVAQTDPLGHRAVTSYTPDELVAQTTGQPNQTVSHVTQYGYDANGNQTLLTDPVGVQTQTVYFSDNRTAQVIAAAQDTTGVYKGVTSYTYDAAGNPLSVASPSASARDANNPLGVATANTYTFDNLLLTETQPYKIPTSGQQQVRRTSFTYDAGGRKLTQSVQVLDGGSGSDGGSQKFAYYPDDRQSTQTGRGGETISTQYDAAGNPTSIADSTSGTITAQYYLDSKPRYVGDFARFSGDPVRAVRYVWDGLGSLLTRTDGVTAGPSNWYYATGYAYGDAEQLTYDVANLTSWNTITYSYDVAGRQLSQVNPSGTTVSRTYNDDGTLASQVATMNGQSSNLESWCYAYDGNYRQLSQTVAAGGTGTTCAGGTTYSYNYDPGNRLCGFHANGSLPACSATTSPDRIAYDHDGNRLSYTPQGATQASTFAYNADDSIATGPSAAGQSSAHTYDAVGRLLSDTCTKYSYDGFDRTTGVAGDTGCPTAPGAAYAYDGLDRQIEHTEGGVSTSNHFDGLTSAIVTTKKVNSGSNETAYEVDPAGRQLLLLNMNWTGSPNYIRQYLSDDGHGNIATVTADLPSTATLCGVRYDPWGTMLAAPTGLSQCVYSGTNPAPNTLNEFYYRGGRRDATTGDYQFGSRTYDPSKADFLTRDTYRQAAPAADLGVGTDPLTENRYSYVNGDPVNLIDPNGHAPIMPMCDGQPCGASPKPQSGGTTARPAISSTQNWNPSAGGLARAPATALPSCPAGYGVPRHSLGGLSTCQAIQTLITAYSECAQSGDPHILQECLTLLSIAGQKIESFNPFDCIPEHDNNLDAACKAEASKPKPSLLQVAGFGALNTFFGLLQGMGGFADESVLPTAELGAAGTRAAVGSGELPADILGSFAKGAAGRIDLERDLIVFRYSGGVSNAFGRFLTDAPTVNGIGGFGDVARNALNLPPGATAAQLNAFMIPRGTTIYVGGVEGGASYAQQIFINDPGVLVPLGSGGG